MLHTRPGRTKWSVAALYGLVGGVVIAVLVMAFVWPAATSKPQNLPVGISGPDRPGRRPGSRARRAGSRAFTLVEVDSRDDAVAQIESRELYGAILLDEPEVLVATAASPIAAQALRGVATQLQTQISETAQAALVAQLQQLGAALASGQPPTAPPASGAAPEIPQVAVTDVVPLADSDPTGAGLAAASFPLTIGGMLGGILLSLLVAGAVRRLIGLLVFGVTAGALAALVMQTWFGLLQGDWLLNAAALGLGMTATAAFITGMNAVFGRAGTRHRGHRHDPGRQPDRGRDRPVAVPSRAVGSDRAVLRARCRVEPPAVAELLPRGADRDAVDDPGLLARPAASCSRSSGTSATRPTCAYPPISSRRRRMPRSSAPERPGVPAGSVASHSA